MTTQRSPIQRSISWLLVGLIGLFALASLGNVQEFIHQYHTGWTGWMLGGGFGVTVFVCAYLAATAKTRSTRIWALAVAGIFGVSSGFFQTWLYMEGNAPWYVAGLLSFIPIVIGEVGLALVESSYSRERDNQASDDVLTQHQQQLELLQNRLNQSEQSAAQVQHELNQARQMADKRQTEADKVRAELDALRTEHDRLQKEFNEFEPAAILARLDDAKREKVSAILETVQTERVTKPSDLMMFGHGKSDVYALWPLVETSRLAYPNGDGAYHVRGGK